MWGGVVGWVLVGWLLLLCLLLCGVWGVGLKKRGAREGGGGGGGKFCFFA